MLLWFREPVPALSFTHPKYSAGSWDFQHQRATRKVWLTLLFSAKMIENCSYAILGKNIPSNSRPVPGDVVPWALWQINWSLIARNWSLICTKNALNGGRYMATNLAMCIKVSLRVRHVLAHQKDDSSEAQMNREVDNAAFFWRNCLPVAWTAALFG